MRRPWHTADVDAAVERIQDHALARYEAEQDALQARSDELLDEYEAMTHDYSEALEE